LLNLHTFLLLNTKEKIMPTESISMRKLKEILRLKYQSKLSHRKIAKSLSISPSTISNYITRAKMLGIEAWPLPDEWNDTKLSKHFLQTQHTPRTAIPLPNWPEFQLELKCKGVTKQLLWQEYVERNSDNYYSYPQLCRHYKEWASKLQPSMRQNHKAGEKLFIDYCGPTLQLVNPDTGECRSAQVFVAVLGASNYTYAEATLSQKLEDWVMSHVRCFEFLGGVPDLLIPDNLKSATTRACKYDPDLNPTYQQMAAH
jgi:transposase